MSKDPTKLFEELKRLKEAVTDHQHLKNCALEAFHKLVEHTYESEADEEFVHSAIDRCLELHRNSHNF